MKLSAEKCRRLTLARLVSIAANLRNTADEIESLARRLDDENETEETDVHAEE